MCRLHCASLLAMSIRAGIVVSISFQQINAAPYAERASECDNESLKSIDCRIEKIHIYTFLSFLLFHNFLLVYCNYEFSVLLE